MKQSLPRQAIEKREHVGRRIDVLKLGLQRRNQVFDRSPVAALNDRGSCIIQYKHALGKYKLMLLTNRVPAIAGVADEERSADGCGRTHVSRAFRLTATRRGARVAGCGRAHRV